MCIIAYKPAGVAQPSKAILKNCFSNNPDYCGYMYSENNQVHIRKGFSGVRTLRKSINENITDILNTPIVYHFRIATSGKIKPGNSHPFPLSSSVTDLQSLSISCDSGMVHNGIFQGLGDKKISDTMELIRDTLSRFSFAELCTSKILNLLDMAFDGNRIVILNRDGEALTFGDWVENEGIAYSNTTYKQESRAFWSGYSGGKNGNKKDYYNYNEPYYDSLIDDPAEYIECQVCGVMFHVEETIDGICTGCYERYFKDECKIWKGDLLTDAPF